MTIKNLTALVVGAVSYVWLHVPHLIGVLAALLLVDGVLRLAGALKHRQPVAPVLDGYVAHLVIFGTLLVLAGVGQGYAQVPALTTVAGILIATEVSRVLSMLGNVGVVPTGIFGPTTPTEPPTKGGAGNGAA